MTREVAIARDSVAFLDDRYVTVIPDWLTTARRLRKFWPRDKSYLQLQSQVLPNAREAITSKKCIGYAAIGVTQDCI